MKKNITLLTALCLMLLTGYNYAQTIPNAGFESWTNTHKAEFWNSLDTMSGYSLTQSTDAYSGTYAAKLATFTVLFVIKVPGIMTLGDFQGTNTAGGIPCTDRPTRLNGYYKFTSGSGDSMRVYVQLTKYLGGSTQTVGDAYFWTNTSAVAYSELSVDINYYLPDSPDTMNITFLSSSYPAHDGTALYLDDLSFETVSDVKETNIEKPVTVYPSPVINTLYIGNLPLNGKNTVTIYDMLGKDVKNLVSSNKQEEIISVSALTDGIYYVKVISENKEPVTKKIIVQH